MRRRGVRFTLRFGTCGGAAERGRAAGPARVPALPAVLAFLALLALTPVAAAEPEGVAMVQQLNARFETLFLAGRYEEALAAAEQAAAQAKRLLGPDHRETGNSLNNLGVAYAGVGRFAEAETAHQRALALRERAFGPDDPDTGESLLNLGQLYVQLERAEEAERLLRRSLDIHERALGPDHARTGLSLGTLADLLAQQGRGAEAEPLFRRTLAILERASGPDHPDTIAARNNLAALYVDTARYAEAEPLLRAALASGERTFGGDHPALANIRNNLGALLYTQLGRPAEAEALFRQALEIGERFYGPDHPALGRELDNLAQVVEAQGRFAEAETLARRALALNERWLGRDHPSTIRILNILGVLARDQGRAAEAAEALRRALALQERTLGEDHPDTVATLGNLALTYADQGRFAEAEALDRRAVAALQRTLGPDHPQTAIALNNHARMLTELHRPAEAEPLLRRALEIRERALGADHPEIAVGLSNLAGVERDLGRFEEAEDLYRRALDASRRALGPNHPQAAAIMSNLAGLYRGQPDRAAEAEPLFRQAAEILRQAHGPDHPDTAQGLYNVASPLIDQGRLAEALPVVREASGIMRRWLRRSALAGAGSGGEALARTLKPQEIFTGHLMLLTLLGQAGALDPATVASESFAVAQLRRSTAAAQALARMAARVAAGGGALAEPVRRRQDAAARWDVLDAQLVAAMGRPAAERDADAVARLRAELAALQAEMADLDATLARADPGFAELAQPEPLDLAAAQTLLRPDEALVAYLVDDRMTHAWVVRPDRAEVRLLPVPREDLAATVEVLRRGLDARHPASGAVRTDGPAPPPGGFDVERAHALYRQIWEPIAPLLDGVRHVMVVPDRALESLPFAVLVTAPPAAPLTRPDELRGVAWLLRDHALTTLPAVGSLRALRQAAAPGARRRGFAGFGDPVLPGLAEAAAATQVSGLFRREGGRNLPPLAETAGELRALARLLGAGESDLYLGPRATERQIRSLDLSQVGLLAFATHGLMAGDLPGLGEPALVLTPPETPSAEDDGLLTASEIAALRLGADWVILSACNTAAADGTPGAEGLSGLARAFFYAGARSLLVSHWAVSSPAAVALTTGTLERLAADPALGRAEALRQTMLALADRGPDPRPAYWAPFVVVGEGGAPEAAPGPGVGGR